MKRIVTFIICLVLASVLSISAFAASASLSGVPAELKKDATATVTVSLSGTPTLSSALVQVTLGDGLELVSGEWKKDGLMKDFTVANGYGVLALSAPGNLDGTAFSFVIKGKTVSATAQNITVNFTFKSGQSEVGTAAVTKSVKVVCATHTLGNYMKKDAANHTRTCSVCGYVETTAHTWNGGEVNKTADCKEAGNKHFTCTAAGCGATRDDPIAKTNNHTYGAWGQTSAPKCTTVGKEARTCSTCQKVETRDIKALGHNLGSWSQTKAPDCTNKGQETRSCSRCTHKETRDVNALGHAFSSPTVTKQPTCTETGIETGTCTRCKKTTTNTVPAAGHKMSESVVTKKPTCTEAGMKEGTCSVCGTKAQEEVPAKGHAFGEGVVTKEATETETGVKTYTCSVCGETKEEEIPVISATPTTTTKAPTTTTKAPAKEESSSPVGIIIAVVAVVLAGGGAAAWYFLVFKKK